MPPRSQEVTHTPDKYEPTHDHQDVCQPLRRRDATSTTRRSISNTISYHIRVEIVSVWIRRRATHTHVPIAGAVAHGAATAATAARALHREAVLYERDAQAGARPVLGRVRGVQEIGEQEADELEGHGDHGVPDEAEDGADGEAVDEDFVADHAGREDRGFPVGRRGVCGGLFVGLCGHALACIL